MSRRTVELNMARMQPSERETVIRWDDDEKVVVVRSCSGPVLR